MRYVTMGWRNMWFEIQRKCPHGKCLFCYVVGEALLASLHIW